MEDQTPLFPEGSSSNSHLRPSLFELLAQEQLRDLLHPVVRYVLSYLAQHYPRYFLRVLNRHEELFALLLLAVERHHLKKHNASLSEHFYQLRLVPSGGIATPRLSSFDSSQKRNLSRRQRWGLLVFLVGLPYVRARAQDYFERLGGSSGDAIHGDGEEERGMARTKIQRGFKLLYPYLNLGLDLTLLSYDIAYLFEKTRYYRPWHRWLGLAIERRVPDDPNITAVGPGRIWDNLPPLLPPLLLLLKLSQWWYSPSSPRTLSTPQSTTIAALHRHIRPPRPLPILPSSGLASGEDEQPPPYDATSSPRAKEEKAAPPAYAITKQEYGRCPLCKRKWQNPAVLPSGWVVCWRCGWDAIEGDDNDEEEEAAADSEVSDQDEEVMKELEDVDRNPVGGEHKSKRRGRCPITGMEVLPGQLRRVLV